MKIAAALDKALKSAGFSGASLEASPDVIFITDRRAQIVYCNPAWTTFANQNGGPTWNATPSWVSMASTAFRDSFELGTSIFTGTSC